MNGPPAGPSDASTGETTIHTGYDWAHTSPMFAVLDTVSDAESVQPMDLPSLDASVDPDALNRLFERTPGGPNETGVRIEFSYADREVTVEGDGRVLVTPRWGVD